ncbi:HAD family hydrolase [Pseudoroseicyclus sp. CXY001]|uniref:HAD family hydrolase n=1 Tax=Pseudoroseicyclus sp. CXY001 TaxID=3242492 RepID=UPI003570AE4C
MAQKALLFDLDGTMLDTDPLHRAVFAELLSPFGIEVDEAFYMENILGRLNEDMFADFLPDHPDPVGLSEEKEATFRRHLPRPYPETPGLSALVNRAEIAGWRLGVVTNAPRLNAEAMLDAVGLRARMEALVVGEECAHGKPHPDPYLAGMTALGASPETTLVFEDSASGVRAGAAAGAKVIGIRTNLTDAALRDAGASLTIQDFNDSALGPVLDALAGVPA